MGNIALLVSREEMIHQAHNILQEKQYKIQQMRVIETQQAVTEARRAMTDGASIIIARGLQASLMKQYTDIPVVEIVLTAQEMALLVVRAKQILKKKKPVIAVVGFRNMFCDMSYFDELYEIELRTYYADQGAELPAAVQTAINDGVDLVIGGDTAVSAAASAGVASLFLSMTEDSMRQAFSMAESMEYAMEVEKKTAAQMETLLDYSFSGVIRLDRSGIIMAINPLMEEILGKKQEVLKGCSVRELAPMIGEDALNQVLFEGKDYSLFLEWNQTPVFAVLAPILYENHVDGAIITCHKMKRAAPPSKNETRKKQGNGQALPPLVRFEDILHRSKAMQDCVRMASFYALSEQPVVILGEAGTENRMLAESIHNSSWRKNGPFLDIPCEGLSGEEQRSMIFGEGGAAVQTQGGTLLLRDVETLTAANQYRLYQLIRFRVCYGNEIARLPRMDVRVMVTVGQKLSVLMHQNMIREDLYYLLSGLELFVPPLRERKEDLLRKLEDTFSDCCERYARYHVLTSGAKEFLMKYPWKGNLFQVESFCERLVLTVGKRSIDEITIGKLLEELYPQSLEDGLGKPEGSREADEILAALEAHRGNREKTAQALGISKATLWRRMKKHRIEIN